MYEIFHLQQHIFHYQLNHVLIKKSKEKFAYKKKKKNNKLSSRIMPMILENSGLDSQRILIKTENSIQKPNNTKESYL